MAELPNWAISSNWSVLLWEQAHVSLFRTHSSCASDKQNYWNDHNAYPVINCFNSKGWEDESRWFICNEGFKSRCKDIRYGSFTDLGFTKIGDFENQRGCDCVHDLWLASHGGKQLRMRGMLNRFRISLGLIKVNTFNSLYCKTIVTIKTYVFNCIYCKKRFRKL